MDDLLLNTRVDAVKKALGDDKFAYLGQALQNNDITAPRDRARFFAAITSRSLATDMGKEEMVEAALVWAKTHDRNYTFIAAHLLTDMTNSGRKDAHPLYEKFIIDTFAGGINVSNMLSDFKHNALSHKRNKLWDGDKCIGYYDHIMVRAYMDICDHDIHAMGSPISYYTVFTKMVRLFGDGSISYFQTIGFDTIVSVLMLPSRYFSRYRLTSKNILQILMDIHQDSNEYMWFLRFLHSIETHHGALSFSVSSITKKWVDEHYEIPLDFEIESAQAGGIVNFDQYNHELATLLHIVHHAINENSAHICDPDIVCKDTSEHIGEYLYNFLAQAFAIGNNIKLSDRTLAHMRETLQMLNTVPSFLFSWIMCITKASASVNNDRTSLLSKDYFYYYMPLAKRVSFIHMLHVILQTRDVQSYYRFVLWCHFVPLMDRNLRIIGNDLLTDDDSVFGAVSNNDHISCIDNREQVLSYAINGRVPAQLTTHDGKLITTQSVHFTKLLQDIENMPRTIDDMRARMGTALPDYAIEHAMYKS